MGYRRAHFEKREEKLNGTCRDQLISNHPRYSIQIVYKKRLVKPGDDSCVLRK
jgi:hypothetical protein